MLGKSFGLFFFLKQSKSSKSGTERYVYLRITVDGISRELSTKRTWKQEKWNRSSGRAIGTKEDTKVLNAYLDSLSVKVQQAKGTLLEQNKRVTADSLKQILSGSGGPTKMLLEIFVHHNKQMEELVGKEFSPLTLKRYKTTFSHTKAFIQSKYNADDIDIRDLDYEFVYDYSFWLKTVRACGHNSTMKYISTLKKITNHCLRKKILSSDPFIDFKTTQKEVEIIPINETELSVLANKEFDVPRLTQVRDIFLFSCFTGLAYVDISGLRRTQIVQGVDGEQWIITKRKKTDSPTRLPLLPTALEIMDRYKDHPKCQNEQYVLPVLTNQKMNAYLKEIADLCKIRKNLTFHISRHTFATTVTLSNGVPIETVSKMLGHKTIKQTQHYAKIVDLKISQDMAALKNKLFPHLSHANN